MTIAADGTYWKINGVKKLLVGGTWGGEPHLYEQQYSDNGITINDATDFMGPELAKIANAGGNYFRCTLVNWSGSYVGNGDQTVYDSVFPFSGSAGNFDLTTISTAWIDRVDALLYRCEALGIIVQLELFDTWWCVKSEWTSSLMWWNPTNVSSPANYLHGNYPTNTGLPVSQDTDNDTFTAPALAAADTCPLLIAQKLYVAAVCTIVKRHGNALIQIQNESIESDAWENYWADYIAAQSVTAPITSMKDDNGNHAMTDSRYDFGDNSQQQSDASNLDTEWTQLIAFHTGTKPVNAVKVYSRWNGAWGYIHIAIDLYFMYFMAGNASCAFHPGTGNTTSISWEGSAGLGTSPMALDGMRAGRWLDDNCDLTAMTAVSTGSSKWGSRPSQGAWGCHGTHYIAIYVVGSTSFTFDTTGIGDTAFKKWYRVDGGSTHSETSETSSTTTSISNPFGNNRALVIISGDGGVGGDPGDPQDPGDTVDVPYVPPTKPIPLAWPFMPQRIHTEAMEWKTDVIRTKAAEERISLRSAPRYAYGYNYIMDERQFSRAKIQCQDGEDVYLPIWSEFTEVASVSAAAESLTFDTSYAHYIVGGQAIIWSDDSTFEVVTLATVSGTGITWTGGLAETHTNAFVMPVKTCKFASALKTTRYAKTYSNTSVGFITTETEDLSADGGVVYPTSQSLSITNSDAETGDLTGWTKVSGDWIAHNAWGSSPSGGYYFIPSISTSTNGVLRQDIALVVGDLTALIIDEGKSTITITWEQDLGLGESQDSGNIKLTFLDTGSSVISSTSSPSKDFSASGWETVTFDAQVPATARTVRLDIEAQFGGDGLYNDSKWDNVRASVTQSATIPEVATTVLLDCNVLQSGTLSESYLDEMDVLDYETGDLWSDEAYRYPMRHSIFSWHNSDREEQWDVRQWLHDRRGRWGLFWLPSWNNDFEVTTAIDSADTTIVIKDIGYADHVDIIRYGMITDNAGGKYFFRILSADNTVTPGYETLTLGEAFGATLSLAEISQGSFLTLMRLSADRVEIKHNDAGQSFISVPLMDPIFNGGVIGSIAGTMPAVTGSLSGWSSLHATIAGTLPAVTGSATGTVKQYFATIAGTLPAITGSAEGWISLHATAAGTLPAITGSVTATYTSP